jgi:predicted DCC family thiol-disulfide oxidoreductase YuxK
METVFYDGGCGLCHATVRFVIVRDRRGRFRYAPLGGATFQASISESERAGLPDSFVVRTDDGRLLVRSTAVAHLLRNLGGAWPVVGALLSIVPRPLRDVGYRFVALVRRRLFAAPTEACPIVPPELRPRFLA